MKPAVKEFQDDTELMAEVRRQASNGISKDDLYVISHDDDRTERVADAVDANEPDDLNELVGTLYTKKGEELRAIFEEFDFSSDEASNLEEKLDHGKILLLINT
ncbi:general stress protein [Brevibacterium sp. RIT 803]|uniref:general stress protein n=1 Tax=Brevibacterium sp. RIT 803 TaxID=2810210 RepID=UPI0019527F68|nr:general stress protein [Brevibacterium sp. RIT 803]MBM6590941.1 general stress protein [Brevibacterium sp. RIT 803]